MSEQFIRAEPAGRVSIAHIVCPKVSDRESGIMTPELCMMAERQGWRLVIDMTDVTLLSSAGIGMLINVRKRCKEAKGALVIYGMSAELQKLLKITHLEKFFKQVKDKESALRAFE